MAPGWTRREYLRAGACSTGLALAGCTRLTNSEGLPGPGQLSADATLVSGESYETGDGWSVTIETVRVRTAIVESTGTHPDPLYVDGAQFVVADATVAGDGAPVPADLNLFVDTDTMERSDRRYVASDANEDGRRQRFGFPVPVSPPPSDGAVVWRPEEADPVRWRLPDAVLTAIAEPPRFQLHEFEASDVPGDDIEVTLTVENTGDGAGTFLAEVGDDAMSDQPELQVAVEVGEMVTATRRVWAAFRGRDELTVVLRWRDGTVRQTVRKR